MFVIIEFFIIAFLAGIAAFQGPINSQLASRTGLFAANVLSNLIGTLVLIVVMAIVEPQALQLQYWASRIKLGEFPIVLLLGGILGSLFMVIMVIAIPRIGTTGWIIAALAGQLTVAMILDASGLLGLDKRPIDLVRIVGILIVIGGAILTLKAR